MDRSGNNSSAGPAPETPTRELLHRGAKFNFERLTFPGADGRTLSREIVRHPGAVVILPVLDRGNGIEIVLIRNFRIAINDWCIELPAGTRDRDEPVEACAARELEEETGYTAATLRPLCRFHTTPGLTDELMHAFIATGLTHVGQRLEADERLTVHPASIEEVWKLVDRGEITDGKTLVALMAAARNGLIPSGGINHQQAPHRPG